MIGLDNINSYYSRDLKFSRIEQLGVTRSSVEKKTVVLLDSEKDRSGKFSIIKADFSDRTAIEEVFDRYDL